MANSSPASSFYDIVPTDACVAEALEQVKNVDFIAFDQTFFDVIGPSAKLEIIQEFPKNQNHVHEAPVYLEEFNELLYSDTTDIGLLHAINIDTYEVRQIELTPALQNVNGATLHNGTVYVTTNGGPVRGIYTVDLTTGAAETVVNNYRGRHLNSPNDVIVDSKGNMYFTDPTYGIDNGWKDVQPPELPQAIYRFNLHTKSLRALSDNVVTKPNGLALSPDESILYVADSNSSSEAAASQRAVFAFDNHVAGLVDNPRLVHLVENGWLDGVRTTKNGLLFAAVYGGLDVVDPATGVLLGKVNTPDDIIYNVEPARGKRVWLLTGRDHIYKVTMQEPPVPAC
jgi:gluconolactonase